MEDENAKKIILNAVKTTEPSWSTWGVHWNEINDAFLGRAYDQLGFDNWMFITDLKNNNLSIEKIGSILEHGNFERKYDREIAGSLTGPLYILMKKGLFGEEGVNFYKSVEEFDGRKGAAFYKLLWQMLVSCNYLKTHYHADFQVYLRPSMLNIRIPLMFQRMNFYLCLRTNGMSLRIQDLGMSYMA
jgi:hypothetical protein